VKFISNVEQHLFPDFVVYSLRGIDLCCLHAWDRYELFFKLIRSGVLEQYYEIDPANSWMIAAAEADIPVYCPGWEDSTSGNIIVSEKIMGNIKGYPIKSGLEQMEDLVSCVTICVNTPSSCVRTSCVTHFSPPALSSFIVVGTRKRSKIQTSAFSRLVAELPEISQYVRSL